jgi:hypothetical protein
VLRSSASPRCNTNWCASPLTCRYNNPTDIFHRCPASAAAGRATTRFYASTGHLSAYIARRGRVHPVRAALSFLTSVNWPSSIVVDCELSSLRLPRERRRYASCSCLRLGLCRRRETCWTTMATTKAWRWISPHRCSPQCFSIPKMYGQDSANEVWAFFANLRSNTYLLHPLSISSLYPPPFLDFIPVVVLFSGHMYF